jgi:hypothetical protein
MSDDRGFISTIRDMLLSEDAGVSASDGLATNAVGSGKVAGLGVPPQGEPGAHRRRKREAFKSPRDQRLYRKMLKGGHVEISESGRWRFGLGLFEKDADAVELHPVLPDRPSDKELAPHLKVTKKRKMRVPLKGGGEILLHPELPNRNFGESAVDESRRTAQRPTAKCDYLCKIGLAADDLEHLTWYRNVLKDPSICINNATMRPVISNVLNHILDLVFSDSVLYNRLRLLLLQEREREQSESVVDVSENNERFRRWSETTTFYQERARSMITPSPEEA